MIYYNSSTFSAPKQHATFKNDQEVPIASVRIKAVELEIHAPFDDIDQSHARDAPFDFWGGGPRLLLSVI